ncbi:unnamed protein product [Rotaria magnacalcarata]|uniref:Uncharacterized protein n=2 Tax=Rotaria magnacalcarata TaxID=392030 RepID=A0A816QWE9_9BILA|nr:unnamed protein product [Rotaria magnacalcarata]
MRIDENKPKEEIHMDTRDLTCPICMCIAEDPQISSCCNRVFCSKDADLNQYSNGCPLCRQKHFSFKSSPTHKEMLDQLTIKCVCSEHIAPDEYETHLERCTQTSFICPHKTCREKNDLKQYNSQELINHLARYHCNEVSLNGSTFINKKSIGAYKNSSIKYSSLVSTLYSVLYPKMVDIQLKTPSSNERNSSIFECPQGHKLIEADYTKRKRKNGSAYSSPSYNCDVCHHSFPNGQSWHCSCTDSGFDKCVACLAFQLYNIDNKILKLASQDREKQEEHYGGDAIRNIVHLPRGLFRLLTGNVDDEDEDEDPDILALRRRSSLYSGSNIFQGTDDNENEVNHPEI